MRKVLLILASFLFYNLISAQGHFTESEVWKNRQPADISEYFVYGLVVTRNQSVLAFSEARLRPGDASPHHIVTRRSKDGGYTWLPSHILVKSKDGESFANPTPVIDEATGRITLFYAQNYNNDSSDVFFIYSVNNGIKWSHPKKVTSLFANDPLHRHFHLPGPGHGICLKNGRLLVQVWHRYSTKLPINQRKYGVSVIYSDDSGKHWIAGGYLPSSDSFPANESRLVELPSGKVLLNSRSASSSKKLSDRIESVSSDNGLTWSFPFFSTIPPFPLVDAGINKISDSTGVYLLCSHPLGPGRNDLAISLSPDEGKTWPITQLAHSGPSTYSDIVILGGKEILALFGTGPDKKVLLARFNLTWVRKQ